jgi:hypothetical protein
MEKSRYSFKTFQQNGNLMLGIRVKNPPNLIGTLVKEKE